jgi:hypothetical protein
LTLGLEDDEAAFAEQFAAVVPNPDIRDRILAGIRATLCENPRVGLPLSEDAPEGVWYFFIPEAAAWGIVNLTVLYTFTDETVRLHWIDLPEKLAVK